MLLGSVNSYETLSMTKSKNKEHHENVKSAKVSYFCCWWWGCDEILILLCLLKVSCLKITSHVGV